MNDPSLNSERMARMRSLLVAALSPASLELVDDSHKHVGHVGARGGLGHFSVDIVSDGFADMAPVARHRAIYEALGEMMTTDIHALSIRARTSSEAQ